MISIILLIQDVYFSNLISNIYGQPPKFPFQCPVMSGFPPNPCPPFLSQLPDNGFHRGLNHQWWRVELHMFFSPKSQAYSNKLAVWHLLHLLLPQKISQEGRFSGKVVGSLSGERCEPENSTWKPSCRERFCHVSMTYKLQRSLTVLKTGSKLGNSRSFSRQVRNAHLQSDV